MDLQDILDEMKEIRDNLSFDGGKWLNLGLIRFGELIGKLTVQVQAEAALADPTLDPEPELEPAA